MSKKKARKDNPEITWRQLLDAAIDEPGMIAQCYTTFHDYSIGNQMLVMLQCMFGGIQPGPMAGYRKWQSLDRQVRKGEKALWIWIPYTFKVEEENDDGELVKSKRTGFVMKPAVFVIAQTDGDDEPEFDVPGWDLENALTALDIVQEAYTDTNGNCQGYALKNTFAINPIAEHPEKTTFHEIAHIQLGHAAERLIDDDQTPRNIREVEAEAVAMIVCEALGLDGAEFSRGYIQNWNEAGEPIPEKSAQKIFKAANAILTAGR